MGPRLHPHLPYNSVCRLLHQIYIRLNSDINSLYTLCIFIQNYRNNLLILYQNLMGIGCHNYKETDTGKTWIDGKKIYRMIISVSLKNANVACSAALPSGFDDATSVSGVIRGNGITLGVGYVGDASSGWDNAVPYSVPVVVDKNAGTLYLRPLTNRTGYTAYVILEYTKV